MSRTIQLTRGMVAVVDEEDYEYLSQFSWHAQQCGRLFYAARGVWKEGRTLTIYMHRELCVGLSKDRPFVDHKDGDGLNNRRSNLRACLKGQNNRNRHNQRGGCTSRYLGVCWNSARKRWQTNLRIGNRLKHIGLFAEECDAAQAYNFAAEEVAGEFTAFNFPLEA